MKEIRLTRSFLSKPINSVYILLSIVLLIETVSWSIGFEIKLNQVAALGLPVYVSKLLRILFLPELFTALIVIELVNRFHIWFKLTDVGNNARDIVRYELRFLPVLALSFFVFTPVTQTVRYLLHDFPHYSFDEYWQKYIIENYTWSIYFKYLFPVILIGYIAINISFIRDYMAQRRQAQEDAEALAAEADQKLLTLSETFVPKPTVPSSYLSYLKGRDRHGELDFPVNEVYYFTAGERNCYANIDKGRYTVAKTLSDLEKELEPNTFFRIKREYIVNRQAVLNYAYWQNGKYIVRLNTPDRYEMVIPRARMPEFREWLQDGHSNNGSSSGPAA